MHKNKVGKREREYTYVLLIDWRNLRTCTLLLWWSQWLKGNERRKKKKLTESEEGVSTVMTEKRNAKINPNLPTSWQEGYLISLCALLHLKCVYVHMWHQAPMYPCYSFMSGQHDFKMSQHRDGLLYTSVFDKKKISQCQCIITIICVVCHGSFLTITIQILGCFLLEFCQNSTQCLYHYWILPVMLTEITISLLKT